MFVAPQEIPQQMNGSDCGMFSCMYAESITRGKDITFTQVPGSGLGNLGQLLYTEITCSVVQNSRILIPLAIWGGGGGGGVF